MKASILGFTGLAILLAVGGAAAALRFAPTAPAEGLSLYEGDGSREFRSLAEASGHLLRPIISTPSLVHQVDGASSLILLVNPAAPPTPDFAQRLDRLLEAGATVWLADPDGQYNPWLIGYGASIATQRLATPGSAVPRLVELVAEGPASVQADAPGTIVLRDDAAWSPLLQSTAASAMDVDGDGVVGLTDPPGPHLVGARRTVGRGTLVVVADTSLLMDAAWTPQGNGVFLRDSMFDPLTEASAIYLVESPGSRPLEQSVSRLIEGLASARRLSLTAAGFLAAGFAVALGAAAFAARPYTAFVTHVTNVPELHPEPHLDSSSHNGESP